jgi:hypothetical protein
MAKKKSKKSLIWRLRLPAADDIASGTQRPHARKATFAFDRVDNCISIRRTLQTLAPTEIPLDEIRACCDKTPPAPSSPHDTRHQRADGHSYHEFLSVVNTPEKSEKVKYFADVDR